MATERSAGRRLTDAFLACDALAMVAELAPAAVFHSPVADYEGRDRIGAVLTAVTQVVAVPRPTHLIEGSEETLLAFTAEFEGKAGDGMLLAAGERDRAISQLTLMVMPLAMLLDAIDRMKVLLNAAAPARIEQDELPGRFEAPTTAPACPSSWHGHPRAGGQVCIATRMRRPSLCTRAGSASRSTTRRSRRGAGQIVIAPPGSAHKFVNVGDAPAHMTNIHPRPRMSQEDLE